MEGKTKQDYLNQTIHENSLHPTIKFESVYLDSTLNVLDLKLQLIDGFIITDIYAKPTDSHLYLPYDTSHPQHHKNTVPHEVELRLKRNCGSQAKLETRCLEY